MDLKIYKCAVFVNLTSAYDTVNHRSFLLKAATIIRNTTLVRIIEWLLSNRQFFVEMDGKKSRWRRQKKGLSQESVLAPVLFNLYTNDQPQLPGILRFIYADDLCIAVQSRFFSIIEEKFNDALSFLSKYY